MIKIISIRFCKEKTKEGIRNSYGGEPGGELMRRGFHEPHE